jgi:hypothetical protein
MGRQVIWSDDEIQQLSRNFVCVLDECFDLAPPPWLKTQWLANPRSTALFQQFIKNAPPLWPRNTSTHQGFYVMTAEGGYLAGNFGRTGRDQAEQLLRSSLAKFDQLASQSGWKPKAVPTNPLPFSNGGPVPRGGLRLEAATRDLPRGNETRPGSQTWTKAAFNVNWIDFSPEEARRFVASNSQRQVIPKAMVEKLAMATIRDNVRGQSGWKKGAFRDGELYAELLSQSGSTKQMRISGFVIMSEGSRVLATQVHGRATFDEAAGQRQGANQFNARGDDQAAAPMGVAWRLYKG